MTLGTLRYPTHDISAGILAAVKSRTLYSGGGTFCQWVASAPRLPFGTCRRNLWARYYSVSAGRFNTSPPVGPQKRCQNAITMTSLNGTEDPRSDCRGRAKIGVPVSKY